jgi:transcriptional regulator with XRE-family HTH domain
MNPNETYKSYLIWSYRYGYQDINEAAQALLRISNHHILTKEWIRKAREAQFLSIESAAHKAGLTKEAWRKLEKSEARQKITLESLQKAAEALDCELVYGFKPKAQVTFSRLLWRQIGPVALEIYRNRLRSPKIKPLILGRIADKLMRDPEFRKQKGWSRNQPRKRSN